MLIQNVSNIAAQQTKPVNDGGFSGFAVANSTASPKVAQPSESTVTERPSSAKQLQSAIDNVNKTLQQSNRALEFSVDAETSRTVVKMVDSDTGEVLRQIPSEEMMAISRSIDQFQQGLLLNQKA